MRFISCILSVASFLVASSPSSVVRAQINHGDEVREDAPSKPRRAPQTRVLGEVGGGVLGLAGAIAIGLGSAAIAETTCNLDHESCGTQSSLVGLAGLGAGALILIPSAVHLAGNEQGGHGSFVHTALGNLIGTAAGMGIGLPLLLSGVMLDGGLQAGMGIGVILTAPIIGSILGYELSDDADTANGPTLSFAPSLDLMVRGGLGAAAQGRF
jgi:hypothetical protein